jgi:hypothetical protein
MALVVECGDRTAESDLVDERVDDRQRRRAAFEQYLEPSDVTRELGDALGVALVVEALGKSDETGDVALLTDPFADAWVQGT